jgi:hypothetical protein
MIVGSWVRCDRRYRIAWRNPMPPTSSTPVQACAAALCASLELSHSTWLITALLPGSARMSKYSSPAGDGPALLSSLCRLQTKAAQQVSSSASIIVIQEAGLDGFWVHRLLEANGIESHVVDPASIAVRGVSAEQKPMPSTARPCCGLSWPGSVVNRASAQW